MTTKNTNAVICAVLCALGVLPATAGTDAPWGWAYDENGLSLQSLTNRTEDGGIYLDDADLKDGAKEIRFVQGELAVDHIETVGRDLKFVGHANGTVLKQEPHVVSEFGGAISAEGGSVVVTNLVFEGFYAESAGGALSLYGLTGDSLVVGCRFRKCRSAASAGIGGAVYASAAKGAKVTLALRQTAFTGCEAANGGAVAVERMYPAEEKSIALDITGCTFANNVSSYSGGALWVEGDTTFAQTLFEGNKSGTEGGAVCVGSSDPNYAGAVVRSLAGTVFRGNVAHEESYGWASGGAVALMSADIRFFAERTAFLANTCDLAGGAVFASTNDVVGVSTCVFSNNVVTARNEGEYGYGGALSAENSTFAMTNATVRGSNRGAVDFYNTKAALVNCVVIGNGGDISSTVGSAAATLFATNSAFGTLYCDKGVSLTTNLCLSGRTVADFDGASLRLKGTPDYNPVAAEGIVQDAKDFDGVKYGSQKYGYSMGAFECATEASISSEPYSGTYDGKGHTITVSAGTAVVPVTLKYATAEVGPWSDTMPAYTNVGTYTVWARTDMDLFDPAMVTSNTVTITQPEITLLSASAEKSYDTFPLTTNDVWVFEGKLAADDYLSFGCTGELTNVGTNDNVFTYSITNALGKTVTDNYDVTSSNGTLIVTKRKFPGETQELYLDATNFVYNAYGQGPKVTNDFITVDGANFPIDMFDITENVKTNVSGYVLVIKAKPEHAENFEGQIEVPWCITKAKLVVTAGAEPAMYGAAELTYKWTATGYQGADTADDIGGEAKYSCDYRAGWHAKTYGKAIAVSGLASGNYEFVYVKGDLVVRKRMLTLTAPTKSKTYDGDPLTFGADEITAENEGYYGDECFDYSDFATITDIGTADSTFTYKGNATTLESDYEVTVTPGKTLTVNPRDDQVVVTAASATWSYDGAAHSTNGWSFVNDDLFLSKGDVFIGEIDTDKCKVTTPDEGTVSNLFKTAMIVRYTNETRTAYMDVSKAYGLVVLPGKLAVTNAQLKADLSGLDWEGLYNGAGHTIGEPEVTAQGGQRVTIRYATAEAGPYADAKPSFTNAAEAAYAVWFEATAPWHDAVTNSATVKINRRAVYIDSKTVMEIDKGQTLTAEPFVVAGKGDGFAKDEGVEKFENLATQEGPGTTDATYDVVYKDNTDIATNYTVTKDCGTLTILDKGTLGIEAASEEWTFNGASHSTNGWTKVGDLKDTKDELKVEFDPNSKVTYPDEGLVANVITTVRVWRAGVDVTTNYVIKTFPGTLKVNAFDGINATVTGAEKVYDGEGTNITVKVGDLPYGGTASVRYARSAKGSFVEDNPSFTNVCEETVWAVVSARGYVSKTNSAAVKITKRPVTITSASGIWPYNGEEHATNAFVSVTGFVGTDGIAETNCTGRITDVGTTDNPIGYKLTAGTLAENYTVTAVPGTLAVTAIEMPPLDNEESEEAALSWYAVVTNYDGEGHTFDLAKLEAKIAEQALLAKNNPVIAYTYDTNGIEWAASPYLFTNVSENVFWYRVSADNHKPYFHKVLVKVNPLEVTLTSGSQTFTYDGQPHAYSNVTVTSATKFVEGEGVTTNNFAEVTNVSDSGVKNNTFDYQLLPNTSNVNYVITQEYGDLKVVPAKLPDPDEPEDPTDPFMPGAGPFDGPDLPSPEFPPVPTNREDGTWSKLSNYDVVTNYDGAAHTFDVTALSNKLATLDFKGNEYELAYSLTGAADTWRAEPFSFTDVVETPTSFWYRVAVPNFTNYIHAVGVTITQRVVRIVFPMAEKTYDGTKDLPAPLATNVSTVAENMVEGERFDALGYGYFDKPDAGDRSLTLTNVTLTANDKAKFGNYKIYFGKDGKVLFDPDDKTEEPGPHSFGPEDPNWPKPGDPNEPDLDLPGKINRKGGITFDFTDDANNRIYKAAKWEPPVEVKDGDGLVVAEDEYEVAYYTNIHATVDAAYAVVTMTSNYTGVVTNYFGIKQQPLTIVTEGTNFVYNGAAQSNAVVSIVGLVSGEGKDYVVTNGFTVVTNVDETPAKNVLDYSIKGVAADGDYYVTETWGSLTMVPAAPPPPEEDDPGKDPPNPPPPDDPYAPDPPQDPATGDIVTFSDYDYVGIYDGEAHTLDTNALAAVIAEQVAAGKWLGNTPVVQYSLDGAKNSWVDDPYAFVNVVSTGFWYKVSAPNFSNVIHAVGVTITNRVITLRSGTTTKYLPADGSSVVVSNGFVWAERGSFVGDEYFVATVPTSHEGIEPWGPVDNVFSAVVSPGLAGNYAFICEYGKLAITNKPAGATEIIEEVPDKTGRDIITIVMDNKDAGPWAADKPKELNGLALTVDKNPADKVEIRLKVSEHYDPAAFNLVTNEIVRYAREEEHKPEKEIKDYQYGALDISIGKTHRFYANKGDANPTNEVVTNIGNDLTDLLTIRIPYEFSDKLIDFAVWRHHTYEGAVAPSVLKLGYGPGEADPTTGEYYTTNATEVVLCVKKLSVYVFKSLYLTTPLLTGASRYKYHQAQNAFCAGFDVVCTNGDFSVISNLCYIFEDRSDCYLRDLKSAKHMSDVAGGRFEWKGTVFGKVRMTELEAALRSAGSLYKTNTWGVSDSTYKSSRYVVPAAERKAILAVSTSLEKLAKGDISVLEEKLGYLVWQEDGEEELHFCPLTKRAADVMPAFGATPQPLSLASVNRSLALGLPAVTEDSDPTLRIDSFTVDEGTVSGRVVTSAGDAKGVPGANAVVTVLGAEELQGPYVEIDGAKCDAEGRFSVVTPAGVRFFKVRLEVVNVID